jgi:acetyl-CoA acyltransferase
MIFSMPLGRYLARGNFMAPPSELMGIGSIVANPKVLKTAGLALNDIDLIELNEAFAATVFENLQNQFCSWIAA